ncbi:MAG: hypothetical protein IEMM0006_1828 [bacterium]|nr:MAG: hypothetical protein IEMM0006_1828 [bacterium]
MNIKYFFLVFLSILLLGNIQAQKKILFDATKAETAGNADWIIDADQHNLSFSNGYAVAGNGRESNPQRFPTPAQSSVTASTQETYWTGALSAWGINLVKKGFEVETLPYNGKITYGNSSNPQDLSNYAVFVVDEPNIRFTSAEKTAILQFVYHGGGLFMISDHDRSDRNNDGIDSPSVWNDLMKNNSMQSDPFGISFDLLKFDDKSDNVRNLPGNPILNGPMGTVSELQFFAGTSMTLHPGDNSSAEGLIYRSGSSFGNTNVLFASSTFGKGKVVALGDSSPPDDGTGDPGDRLYNGWTKDANGNHERLIMNASIWLAETLTATNPLKEKNKIEVSFLKKDNECFLKVSNLPAVNSYQLSVFDLQGKEVTNFQQIAPGQTYRFPLPAKAIFVYRLTGANFLKTGKFYY